MDEVRIEKLNMEDGRQAERHIMDDGYCEDEQTRTIDLYVEPERPKTLAKRIVEKRRPCVFRREIETVDENGEVIDRKVESIDPEDKMQLVQHIATHQPSFTAQSMPVTDDCGCPVTREDLKDVMNMMVSKINQNNQKQQQQFAALSVAPVEEEFIEEEEEIDVVQDRVKKRVEQKSDQQISNTTWWLLMVVVAQIAALGYIWVLM